jgi:hypothetical protein
MRQSVLETDISVIRPECGLPPLGVMIEVPHVNLRLAKRQSRGSSRETRIVGRQTHHSRRRLRREVRLVGSALLALIPIASACTLGWSNRPARIVACSISDPLENSVEADRFAEYLPQLSQGADQQSRIDSTGVVMLSVELKIPSPGASPETPVVFPGYVLPDDSREDTLHDGS